MKIPNLKNRPKILTLSFYCITLAIICQAFLPFSSTFATTALNNFYFEDFTADYYLSQADDGTNRLRVVEQFTTIFPTYSQNHGMTRVIPYTNQNGQNLTMPRDDFLTINLWHNGEEIRPYKVEGGDGYFTVYIGSPDEYVRGEQTYILEYEFQNVITNFEEDGKSWQELYWDTNGNDWSQKFENLTATVHFEDQTIADAYTGNISCYVGKYGDSGQNRCTATTIDDGVEFRATNLRAGENLTFDLEFAPNTFKVPGKPLDYRLVFGLIFLILSAAGFGIALLIFRQQIAAKRKFYKDTFIKPEYEPMSGVTVAEMAENYIGKGATGNKKVASLMELAVENKIELIKLQSDSKGKKAKTLWKVKIKSLDLTREQAIILKILAGNDNPLSVGQEIIIKKHTANSTLVRLGEHFTTYTQEDLRHYGYQEYNPQKSKNGKYVAAKNPCGIFITILSIWMFACIVGFTFIFDEVPSYYRLLGGTALSVLIVILFIAIFIINIYLTGKIGPFYTHTEKGLLAARYLDGLKLYIKMAEKDRIAFLQSVDGADTSHQGIVKLYERLLPYAVIFKLEKSWLKEMSRYYEFEDVTNPAWYIGVGAFSAADFSDAITTASNFVATTTTYSTTSNSSSGSSGGGGGGFSGGGGGGGGGGGW